MTVPVYGAGELRKAVRFTDLIEPLRVAFGEFSSGRAQQVMSVLWPARRAWRNGSRRNCLAYAPRPLPRLSTPSGRARSSSPRPPPPSHWWLRRGAPTSATRCHHHLLSRTSPVALVLDDVHVLRDSECRASLSMLADHVPRGSRLVLSGQVEPPLRIARLRAEGRVMEIGPGDLSLTREEASSLLRSAGLVLEEQEVAELHRRTEGWPAGLYLAALYIREGAPLRAGGRLLRR